MVAVDVWVSLPRIRNPNAKILKANIEILNKYEISELKLRNKVLSGNSFQLYTIVLNLGFLPFQIYLGFRYSDFVFLPNSHYGHSGSRFSKKAARPSSAASVVRAVALTAAPNES